MYAAASLQLLVGLEQELSHFVALLLFYNIGLLVFGQSCDFQLISGLTTNSLFWPHRISDDLFWSGSIELQEEFIANSLLSIMTLGQAPHNGI